MITSRTADVEYIQWEFQDDTIANNYSDLIDTDRMPEKDIELMNLVYLTRQEVLPIVATSQ